MNSTNYAETELRTLIKKVLARNPNGLTFDYLRNELEEIEMIYVDGTKLRKIIAEMIREGTICKEPSPQLKKFVLKLCKQLNK
ncbi:hypothetical protein QPL79_04945 [Ignisphaera sp. 4213-co]|uniref:Uncharacterized protein n=1 Tax=Ignisphaera cupida TaxID=3050454 RepID=A0ABD4Z5W7_9CREN|nr:hypothetical protein [Ignisphaera sp. 4213-co]MDK6028702.1 hypothetical protein [Ignisphaera sp. 4213-co]